VRQTSVTKLHILSRVIDFKFRVAKKGPAGGVERSEKTGGGGVSNTSRPSFQSGSKLGRRKSQTRY